MIEDLPTLIEELEEFLHRMEIVGTHRSDRALEDTAFAGLILVDRLRILLRRQGLDPFVPNN